MFFSSDLKHNFTELTLNAPESEGWTLTHIREGQYTISGIEEDNNERYWNASSFDKEPDEYDAANLIFSGFAWKFEKVTPTEVGILSITEDNIRIYSQNRKIIVENTDNYTIMTVEGLIISKNSELSTGIYLVTANGKTTKILVK